MYNDNMKKIYAIAFILLMVGAGVKAQVFVDSTLNCLCKKMLVEGTSPFVSDIDYMGAVILEVNTGNIIANVSVGYNNKDIVDIPNGNNKAVHAGIGRAVLYLSMMDYLTPNFIVDATGGIYKDSISECVITDHNYKFGGYGRLRLKEALDRSDIGMIKAAEAAFNRNMGSYGTALRKTGIFFSDEVCNTDDTSYSDQLWSPRDILGYSTYMSLIEQTAWVNAIANGGKLVVKESESDPIPPMCVIKNKQGIDSLKSAMREIVEDGLGRKMISTHTCVAGLADVTPVDAEGFRGCLAVAFFPYEKPQYTIGVYINKHGLPAGRLIPTLIVGKIIDSMVEHCYLNDCRKMKNMVVVKDSIHEKCHPAEK